MNAKNEQEVLVKLELIKKEIERMDQTLMPAYVARKMVQVEGDLSLMISFLKIRPK